jgi:hypothetical protein
VVARSRWTSGVRLLIGSCTLLVAFEIPPRPDLLRLFGRDGPSAPGEWQAKERGSPDCSTRIRSILSDEPGCRTAGCERGFTPWQVATRLQKARDRSAADTVRIDAGRNWHSTSMRVQAARVALGESRLRGSQASLNSDCQKNRRKQFSSSTTRHVACNVVVNAFQQYERLVNLATAKFERRCTILGLAHPPFGETARIRWGFTMAAC